MMLTTVLNITAIISWSFNVVCGVCSIAAGFLAIILPETQGKPLCETIDDVDNRT